MTKYVCVWWESEVIQDQICLRCRRKEDDKRQNRFELWVTRTHLETIEDEKRQKHVWVLGENKTGRWCWYWSICSRRWWCQVTIMRRIGGYRHHYKYIHSSKLYHTTYITHCTLSITHGTQWIHLLLQLCHTVCSLIWRSSAVHYWTPTLVSEYNCLELLGNPRPSTASSFLYTLGPNKSGHTQWSFICVWGFANTKYKTLACSMMQKTGHEMLCYVLHIYVL